METPFAYKLVPDSLEREFRSAKEPNDRKQLILIFSMAALFISAFIAIDVQNLAHIPHFQLGISARIVGLLAALAGLLRVRRAYSSLKDQRTVFICGLLIFCHILVNNFTQHADPISIAAWDITAIFAIFALVPIGLAYQITLALTLTAGSQILWLIFAVPQLTVIEIVSTPLAYLAANCFGITLSLNLNRIQRQEFQHLKSERQLRNDLEQTIATRDQLFSVLAHDLRGPIGALTEIGKLLNSTHPIEIRQREKLINLLCTASKTSYDLLENLLSWALSETGSLQPEIKPVHLRSAIATNIELLTASANNKNIQLSAEENQNLSILADPKMLDTILRNLIANAIKFTPAGGQIRIYQLLGPNHTAHISVVDNGIGIPAERLARLFKLDFAETSNGTAGEPGSNLGLRLCADFTAKQGGHISVESAPGQGTTITLTLPLAPAAKSPRP